MLLNNRSHEPPLWLNSFLFSQISDGCVPSVNSMKEKNKYESTSLTKNSTNTKTLWCWVQKVGLLFSCLFFLAIEATQCCEPPLYIFFVPVVLPFFSFSFFLSFCFTRCFVSIVCIAGDESVLKPSNVPHVKSLKNITTD